MNIKQSTPEDAMRERADINRIGTACSLRKTDIRTWRDNNSQPVVWASNNGDWATADPDDACVADWYRTELEALTAYAINQKIKVDPAAAVWNDIGTKPEVGVKLDSANHRPDYYGGEDDPYEPIKVIRAWKLNFALGSVLKYIRRAGLKPGADVLEDLKKARTYIDLEISHLEKERR